MLIHHEDYLPDCPEYVHATLQSLIVNDDAFADAFSGAMERTGGADTDAGDYICSSCIGLALVGEKSCRNDGDRDEAFKDL